MDDETLKNLAGLRASTHSAASRIGERISGRIGDVAAARGVGAEDGILCTLLGAELARVARRTGWSSLIIRTEADATMVSSYVGVRLLAEVALPVARDTPDDPGARAAAVRRWFAERGLRFSELSGIAAAGGFLATVPPGTYRLCDAMVADAAHGGVGHPADLAVPTALALAADAGADAVLTTTDPRSSTETDAAEALVLSPRLRRRSAPTHAAALRAAAALLADAAAVPLGEIEVVAVHFDRESSAARFAAGRMRRVLPCFGALPGSGASGALPVADLLRGLLMRDLRLEEMFAEVFSGAGGLDAVTDPGGGDGDARLAAFAREAASGIMALAAGRAPVDAVVLAGRLADSAALATAIAGRLHLGAPVVRIPGPLEACALCAGLLRACAEPAGVGDYAAVRDRAETERADDERAAAAALFGTAEAAVRGGRPARSMSDIVLAAVSGEGEALPVIAIAGADNEEALLAAKLANNEDGARLARFLLVGPYTAISDLAWELDVPLDEENFFVVDSRHPIDTAVGLYADGVADIVMKGAVTTADLLKGYFTGLKSRGLAKPGLRLSHIGLFDAPARSNLVALADAALNPDPNLDLRCAILENSIAALRALGIERPKVAVISATEKPSDKVLSSIEGREIAERFKDRADLVVEGPISVDLALSPESAREKRYGGRIRGDADLLLVPTIDVGNAIYKSLTVAGATAAGAVIGGAAPIVLTSRGDSARTKLSSIAFAIVLARRSAKEAIR